MAGGLRGVVLRYQPIGANPDLSNGVDARVPSDVLGQLVMAANGMIEAFWLTGTASRPAMAPGSGTTCRSGTWRAPTWPRWRGSTNLRTRQSRAGQSTWGRKRRHGARADHCLRRGAQRSSAVRKRHVNPGTRPAPARTSHLPGSCSVGLARRPRPRPSGRPWPGTLAVRACLAAWVNVVLYNEQVFRGQKRVFVHYPNPCDRLENRSAADRGGTGSPVQYRLGKRRTPSRRRLHRRRPSSHSGDPWRPGCT